MTGKRRLQTPRHEMPLQDRIVRKTNFQEVALGYTQDLAIAEAKRCLQCKKPGCVRGCPVGVLIPQFIKAISEKNITDAVRLMKVKNNLPAICGRVCPQETQCEGSCILGKNAEPVAIGNLERYVGDYELAHRICPLIKPEQTGKRIAVIGSGPAGLTCAVDLAKEGHQVAIFESLHHPGGVLTYGIPEFRLPKSIVSFEIDYALNCLDIKIKNDHIIGRTMTLDELLDKYDAVFIGTGAGLPIFMNIPGINYIGVISANEFLARINLMKAYLFPQYDTPVRIGKRVAVIGAGNVAMDSARCSLRLQRTIGIELGEVRIIYRRSRDEVPARINEFRHAEDEGVIFEFLTNPLEILGDSNGNVIAIKCIRMKLGEPDSKGRRQPIPVIGSEFIIEVDTVIMALGTNPNPLVFKGFDKIQKSKYGTIIVNEKTGESSIKRLWAGGDVVTGSATVISAMGAGKLAAANIHKFLTAETSRN